MLKAKQLESVNVRKLYKTICSSSYSYFILDMEMPLKLSRDNIAQYIINKENSEIGILLNNPSMIEKKDNVVAFSNGKAIVSLAKPKLILKLIQPEGYNFSAWMKIILEYAITLNPSVIMIPIKRESNLMSIEECNLVIQEINSTLLPLVNTGDVVIAQEKENIASLAFIVHNLAFPTKVSLCINIDNMEKSFYNIKDIIDDIVKFNLTNKVSMIKTTRYSETNAVFRELLNILPEDVIVYGEKI